MEGAGKPYEMTPVFDDRAKKRRESLPKFEETSAAGHRETNFVI